MNRHLPGAALALAVTACVASDESISTSTDEASLIIDTCPTWDCGNSATIDNGIHIGELDASGREANARRVSVVGFRSADGTALHLIIDGDRIVGRRKIPGVPYPGTGALYPGPYDGAVLTVSTGAVEEDIVVDHIGQVGSQGDAPVRVAPTYRFVHGPAGTPREDMRALCKDPLPDGPMWAGMTSEDAVVFRGDRYDTRRKRVVATGAAAGDWFNVGCAGSAAAKLHLLRHTEASADDTVRTSRADRQTVLKMYTADYCGTGHTFTRSGEPLLYKLRRTARSSRSDGVARRDRAPIVEALWTTDGAVCLDEARLEAELPGIGDAIAVVCAEFRHPLPSCESLLPSWQDHAYGLSASPR